MTGKFVFGDRLRFLDADLWGGSWESTLPLTNMQRRPTSLRARSTDTSHSSTWFMAQYTDQPQIGMLNFVDHNLTNAATITRAASNTEPPIEDTEATFDSGTKTVTMSLGSELFGTLTPGSKVLFWGSELNDGLYTVVSNTVDSITVAEELADEVVDYLVIVVDVIYAAVGEDAIPAIYDWLNNDFYEPNWWSGKPSAEDFEDLRRQSIHLTTESVRADYWFTGFSDVDNPDGYVECGYGFWANIIRASVGVRGGDEPGLIDESLVEVTKSGVEYFDERRVPRTTRIEIRGLPKNEALGVFYDMGRRKGKTKPLFIIPDPEDTLNLYHEAYLCRFETPPTVTHIPGSNNYTINMNFKELF